MTDTLTKPPAESVPDDPESAGPQPVARLLLVVAALVVASVAFGVWRTVAVMAAVIVMIMLHELGHFVMARRAGMKVTEFFLGFGPRLWSVRKGDTEYGIKAIPVGGYVRVIGMNNLDEVEADDEPYTYRSKGYLARLGMASAGSIVHFLLAFLLLIGIYAGTGVEQADAVPVVAATSTPDFEKVASPAAKAGMREGDRIVALDGQPVKEFAEIPRYIAARANQPIELTVARDGVRKSLTVVPQEIVATDGTKIGRIGIVPRRPIERMNPLAAAGKSVTQLGSVTKQNAIGLYKMFTPESVGDYGRQLTGDDLNDPSGESNRFLSPVGLVNLASDVSNVGLREVLWLLVLINVFVGMFNMIPLPPFDGGHVAVATYEAIRSKISGHRHQVDMNRLLPVAWGVIILLMLISVTALYLDIKSPLDIGG